MDVLIWLSTEVSTIQQLIAKKPKTMNATTDRQKRRVQQLIARKPKTMGVATDR